MTWWEHIKETFAFIFGNKNDSIPVVEIPPEIVAQPIPPPSPAIVHPLLKYDWSTPQSVRHSIRVICDELNFTLEQKNTMCATIQAESGGNFNTRAINKNFFPDGPKKGQLASTDWGLCQWNDFYHGKEISCGYDGDAMNDPEKAVRLMAYYWKKGEIYRRWWIAYKNGLYKQYL